MSRCENGLCKREDCDECNPQQTCQECGQTISDIGECACNQSAEEDDGQPSEAQENNDFAHDDDFPGQDGDL